MIYYQKTPARIVLELIEKAEFKPQECFLIWDPVWVRLP